MITADAGRSHSFQSRASKVERATLGVAITVARMPPHNSKRHNIEHRLLRLISMNYRGGPRTTRRVIVEFVAATQSDLRVEAHPHRGYYPLKKKVSNAEFAAALHGAHLAPQPELHHRTQSPVPASVVRAQALSRNNMRSPVR